MQSLHDYKAQNNPVEHATLKTFLLHKEVFHLYLAFNRMNAGSLLFRTHRQLPTKDALVTANRELPVSRPLRDTFTQMNG
jgi:hypothetical protein